LADELRGPPYGFSGGTLLHDTFVLYLFAIALVATTFALRSWLIPLTATGALIVVYLTLSHEKEGAVTK
jgi:hypothetical protein